MSEPEIDGTVLSYSRVTTYLTCPLKFRYRYIDEIVKPSNMNLVYGKVVHRMLELVNQAAIEGYEIDNVKFEEVLEQVWIEELGSSHLSPPPDFKTTIEHSRNLLNAYINDPDVPVPIKTEEHIVTEDPVYVSGDNKYYLQGYIDGIVKDDNGKGIIVEYKTSGRSWSEHRQSFELQPSFYGFLLGTEEIEVLYEILVKTKSPKVQHLVETRDRKQINSTLKLIKQFAKGVESGLFYPARSFSCENFCDYKDECRKEW